MMAFFSSTANGLVVDGRGTLVLDDRGPASAL